MPICLTAGVVLVEVSVEVSDSPVAPPTPPSVLPPKDSAAEFTFTAVADAVPVAASAVERCPAWVQEVRSSAETMVATAKSCLRTQKSFPYKTLISSTVQNSFRVSLFLRRLTHLSVGIAVALRHEIYGNPSAPPLG